MNKPTGGSAFPHENVFSHRGMTLRDYIAAKALQGFLASPNLRPAKDSEAATAAYLLADAMLKAREQ